MDGTNTQPRVVTGRRAVREGVLRVGLATQDHPSNTSEPPTGALPEADRLARHLVCRGDITFEEVEIARTAMRGQSLSFGQVLTVLELTTEAEILSALAALYCAGIADLCHDPPEMHLAGLLPARASIATEAVIWRRAGSALVIATSRPDKIEEVRSHLPPNTSIITALAPRSQIVEAQRRLYGRTLAREAEGRAPQRHSCRTWRGTLLKRLGWAALIATGILLILQPVLLIAVVFGLALAVFAVNTTLKFAAFATALRHRNPPPPPEGATHLHLPTVSILVPLYHETEIAGALVDRLSCLDYPRERLDIILAVEEDDPLTINALRTTRLPPWMRTVIVPRGHPQTKPRALNYVLGYARGEIVGIYDAEDRPEPDQIRKVVQRFAEVSPDIACLQGRLDYYNSRHNWLAALFTVEYAAWFRVLLPGVEKMGLVVPLGGTTLFLRRSVLEQVGAWDAHNVTEDAELGLRLAREGFGTQILDTTTFEEANAAALPWIRQRSRWLKGYLMTWGTAMRRPGQLLADLGWWRFLGVQVQFFGAVLGFLTAPLLWSFMVKLFGLWHPLDVFLGPIGFGALAVFMVMILIGSIAISIYATAAAHLRHLRPITPLVEPYYILGTAAAWVGLVEMAARPFFWAKTRHGSFGGVDNGPAESSPASAQLSPGE